MRLPVADDFGAEMQVLQGAVVAAHRHPEHTDRDQHDEEGACGGARQAEGSPAAEDAQSHEQVAVRATAQVRATVR